MEGGAPPQKPNELQEELSKMRADYEARIAEIQQKHEEVLREAKKFRAAVPHVTVEGEAEVRTFVELTVFQYQVKAKNKTNKQTN